MNNNTVLAAKKLHHQYGDGDNTITVLEGLNFEVKASQRIAVMGASGAGKSTLLNLLGGLDTPTSGEVWLAGQLLNELSANDRAAARNQSLGFVYQFHHLMPEFTALENAAMPCLIAGHTRKAAFQQASGLLEQVGLSQRLAHKPAQLSGGERQRVAIARALVMSPQCVLLDEPTGNLDSDNASRIQALLASLSQDKGIAFVTVTHDPDLAAKMDACYHLKDGKLTLEAA